MTHVYYTAQNINDTVTDYINRTTHPLIMSDEDDKKKCLQDCINYCTKQITELESQIAYYNEQIKGYKFGIEAFNELEKYELEEVKVYQAKAIDEEIDRYMKYLNECSHTDITISNNGDYIHCDECDMYICPKDVSKDATIVYERYSDWCNEIYYDEMTYDEFYDMFIDEIKSDICKHRNQTKVQFEFKNRSYTVNCCVNCKQIIK